MLCFCWMFIRWKEKITWNRGGCCSCHWVSNCWVTKYHQHLGDSNRHSKNNRGILETSRLHVMNIFLVKCILLKLLWLCCLAMDFAHTSWQSSTQRKCRQPSAILKLSDSGFHLPFGKLTVCYGKIHRFQLVNPRTKWPFFNSYVTNYQRVNGLRNWEKLKNCTVQCLHEICASKAFPASWTLPGCRFNRN